MQPYQFNRLKESLLKNGIAPRHAHRYVRELRDHLEDTLHGELAKGLNRATAEQAAWARLGDEETLAASMLAKPKLRSVISRFPRLIFATTPLLIWIGSLALAFLAFFLVLGASPDVYQTRAFSFGYRVCFFAARILPVILGIAALVLCARQRLNPFWPILGIAIVMLISGTLSLSMTLPTASNMGQFGVSTSLFPFFFHHVEALGKPNVSALAAGLARGACMFAVSLMPYLLWRHRTMDRVCYDETVQ